MKIIQLLENNKINHAYRYAHEFETAIETYHSNNLASIIISENLSKEEIDDINNYDYLFIHSLYNNNETYSKIINNINIKKVLFIHEYSVQEFKYNKNSTYIQQLLYNCYKICVCGWNTALINELKKIFTPEIFEKKIIYTDLIYNFYKQNWVDYHSKNKDFLFINHSENTAKLCNKYITLYKQYKETLDISYFKLFGVSKNIQSINVNDLYVNIETQQKSQITNIVSEYNEQVTDKLNIYETADYSKFQGIAKRSFIVEDLSDNISYTILDSINSGTVIILSASLLKKYKISPTQTLDTLDYILNEENIKDASLFIKETQYEYNRNTVYNVFRRILNAETISKNILDSLKDGEGL